MTVSWTSGTDVHTVTYSAINGELRRDHNGDINVAARDIGSVVFSRLDGAVTTTIVASPDSRWGTMEQHTIITYMQAGS